MGAVAAERATGVPALLSAAQCALESGWLAAAPTNNAFGVKWHKSQETRSRQLVKTREWFSRDYIAKWLAEPGYEGREVIRETGKTKLVDSVLKIEIEARDWFMLYASLAESFTDHARLIQTGAPYRKAWKAFQTHRSPETLMRDISKDYATDPNYTTTVISIMKMPVLVKAIEEARKR